MKALITLLVSLSVLTLIIVSFLKAPKGNDYMQWEKEMIESNQMDVNNSEFFVKVDGVLKLK